MFACANETFWVLVFILPYVFLLHCIRKWIDRHHKH